MKLAELLQHPQFKAIRIANRNADLSTNVTTIGMMEAPDIADYIVKGQLLVTTGYHFVHNIKGLETLIEVMKQKGAAAIGIKDQRYFDSIPESILKTADKHHFPILLLPANIGLSVIVRNLLHTVLEQQTDQLTQIMNDTLYISKYILAERSDNEILDHIAELLRCDVFIIDTFGRLTAKNKEAVINQNLFNYTETKMDLINLQKSQQLLDQYIIYPLKTVNKLTSRFVIFNIPAIRDSSQHLLIANIVNLLSLENMQVSININDERQRKSEFFETLLSKSIPEEMFVDNLKFQGLNIHDRCQAFAIDEANSVDTGNHQFSMHKITNYIYWYFEKIEVPIIVINWHFKIFVLVKSDYDIREILDGLLSFLNDSFADFKIRIGFTSYIKDLLNFKKLMNESNEALQIAKRNQQSMPNEFRPKQVDDILHFIPTGEANMFIDSLLGPILKLESDEKKQLMELLIQYFSENQSLSRAADNLFLHRNTAVYRLKKIEKTLSLSLKNPKEVEQLSLAIKLYSIDQPHNSEA